MPESSPASSRNRLRIYVDADVLLASAASPSEHSAGRVLLTLSEITLIDAITSELAVEECHRNLRKKLPDALDAFQLLAKRALRIVAPPAVDTVRAYAGHAQWKDVPHLACAVEQTCAYLVTCNLRDYEPGHDWIDVVRPGRLVRHVRDHLMDA